ncbi:MAG: tetratricopeptide repeat protein [Armatimonadota bacterium]|nr:tetratricopeptide repeat protein [Armatimonadota bacterium]
MRREHLVLPLLLVVTLGVFWEVRGHDFLHWDETFHVVENRHLNPPSWGGVLRFWREPYEGLYIPAVYSVWAALVYFGLRRAADGTALSLDPGLFHTFNLAVHVLSVLAVYALLRRLRYAPWPAAGGSLLFAIHPLQVEPVAWVAGLRDLLGGFFSLLAVVLYVSGIPRPHRAVPRRLTRLLAFGAWILALLSKPGSAAIPLVLLALERWVFGRPFRESLRALWPWAAVALMALFITSRAQESGHFVTPPPLWARPFVAGDALAFYVAKLVWPVWLIPDYGRTPQQVLAHPWGYLTWVVPAALGVWVWRKRGQAPTLLAAAALFVAALLPVLGLVPFAFQRYSTVADRYVYLAMLGPALALAEALCRARSRFLPVIAAVGLASLAACSAFQVLHWHNDATLWTYTLQHNPRSWFAYHNLGTALQEEGKMQEAMECYRRALEVRPDSPETHANMGTLEERWGNLAAARQHFEAAVRLMPDWPLARTNLAGVLIRLGEPEAAATHCRVALERLPDDPDAHMKLALALSALGRHGEAVKHARQAVRLRPWAAVESYNLGNVLLDAGRPVEAVAAFREAVRLNPGWVEARMNLAAALEKQGAPEDAIRAYEDVLRLQEDFPPAHLALARLLEREGRAAEAVAHYRRVAEMAPPGSPVGRAVQDALHRLAPSGRRP